jgi:hypothetical protein
LAGRIPLEDIRRRLWWRLVLSMRIEGWLLTSLQKRLVTIVKYSTPAADRR